MKHNWTRHELDEHFTLLPYEFELIGNKTGKNRLAFIVLFKFFQIEQRFPNRQYDIPQAIINHIACQLDLDPAIYPDFQWDSRTHKEHRVQIRKHFEFQEATIRDLESIEEWLSQELSINDHKVDSIKAEVYRRFSEQRIEPPTEKRIDRLVNSVIYNREQRIFRETFQKLSAVSCQQIDELLSNKKEGLFELLRNSPGRMSLESILQELDKLSCIHHIQLPGNIFENVSPKIIKQYCQRVVSESLSELRQHPEYVRYTLVSAFLYLRGQGIIDNIVELLLQMVHKVTTRSERKVGQELLKEFKRVNGKTNILFRMANISVQQPQGVIHETIYPVIGEQTLLALVEESKHTGRTYQEKVFNKMRKSYGQHYRRSLPRLLTTLNFRSNNERHQPVVQAIETLKSALNSNKRYFLTDELPIQDVVPSGWQDILIEQDSQGNDRIKSIDYELCALQSLRDRLRCKEIWVPGANRYRNPDEDLPVDFEQYREHHYKVLNQPLDIEIFINQVKSSLDQALVQFNDNLPKNPKVKLIGKGKKGWISVSPLEAQLAPLQLSLIKAEIGRRWPMTNLMDIFKETDLRLSFTRHFKTVADRECLEPAVLQRRLLYCLFGLGTNTGLKRMSFAETGETYRELRYVREKFITKDNLRNAITEVVNAILKIRHPAVWGEGTTSCASDSKKFGAWDQNLMTEWHIRYHGRGIMIYWHVEKKSACIYSQLKSCSSSEVAAMMEGVLRHCTDMNVEKNYTDSHGQSEVAFAFCYLLGFKLMPRIKRIGTKKLYRSESGKPDAYPNLQRILTRPIDWDLIRTQYDQMIKYATALRLGTAETEAILKRFTRENLQHPTYQALYELGRAIQTIFLCEYLGDETIRQEIQEGLNVMENWNSANSFIFYGKGGEIATNRLEEQELSVLCLHLVQNCLIYVNTLLYQDVLSSPQWFSQMKTEDFRAITPLIYHHVNPYGEFKLDLETRIPIERSARGAVLRQAVLSRTV